MREQLEDLDLADVASKWHMAFGIVHRAGESISGDNEMLLRLTRRRLLLHNRLAHHRLFDGPSLNAIAESANQAGFQFVLIQHAGFVITDTECFARGMAAIFQLPFVIAGFVDDTPGVKSVIDERCVLVNLAQWARLGRPLLPFDCGINNLVAFPAAIRPSTLCLASDSESRNRALADLYGAVQHWKWKVWFVNTDDLFNRDVVNEFVGPVRRLIALPSGLMANQILHALSFNKDTTVVFYDRNPHALAFRKFLVQSWDGRDYEDAVNRWMNSKPFASCSVNVEELTQGTRNLHKYFGSRDEFVVHWNKYRSLVHEFVVGDLFASSAHDVVDKIDPECRNTVIWWSNIFHSLETHTFQTEDETSNLFHQWIKALRNRNNKLTIFGLDAEGKLIAGPVDRPMDRSQCGPDFSGPKDLP